MHDILLSNVIFHSLATLALLVVSAATALRDPLRRREPRRYTLDGVAATNTSPARLPHAAHASARSLDIDLELADAA